MTRLNFIRFWSRWWPLAVFGVAIVAEVALLHLNWAADTQAYKSLQRMNVQSGYELHMEHAAGQGNNTIVSYQGSAAHDHLITLEMENASLATDSQQTLLPFAAALSLPDLSKLSGKLLYAPDPAPHPKETGQPCYMSVYVDFFDQPGSSIRSVGLYPPGPEEFIDPSRMRILHLRSASPLLVRISADSQDNKAGPNCWNLLSIGDWQQGISHDMEMHFIAAPNSETTVKISPVSAAGGFPAGAKEVEPLELQPLHPSRLFITPLGERRAEQIRSEAGSSQMTVNNLGLSGDSLQVELHGRVGLLVADLLGPWRWPVLALLNIPLALWAGRRVARSLRNVADFYHVEPASPDAPVRSLFLSYSWEDRERVMHIYNLLKAAGADPWIDAEAIRGGAEWEESIEEQMKKSERVIIFLSNSSLQKTGFAWVEIRMATRLAEQQPEGKPFIIPVKLEKCPLPGLLARWHSIDLYQMDGEAKLLKSLGLQHSATRIQPARAV